MGPYQVVHAWHCTTRPLLPCVPRVYVLTMTNSKRMHRLRTDPLLCSLCADLYIQYNQGRACKLKPSWVDNARNDILHAYENVCMIERARWGAASPVLILEDDAVFEADAFTRGAFHHVNEFVQHEEPMNWDFYALGAAAFLVPYTLFHYRIKVFQAGCHAVIWSPRSLLAFDAARLASSKVGVDNYMLTQNTFTYAFPLATQTWPYTENKMTSWVVCLGTVCTDEAYIYAAIVSAIHVVLGLDKAVRPGWDVITVTNHLPVICLVYACIYCILRIL